MFDNILDTLSRRRGDDIPRERAEAEEQEMLRRIMSSQSDPPLTLENFLKLYAREIPDLGGDTHNSMMDDSYGHFREFSAIKIYIECKEHPLNLNYPLILHNPILDSILATDRSYEIKNMRHFLADYQRATNTWIGADDILKARVVGFYSAHDRYAGELVVKCEM